MKHIKFYITALCLLLIENSCIDDFNELTDSEYQTISVEIVPLGWYDDIFEITETDFEKRRISLETDKEHSLRVTGFCYDNKDSLLAVCEILTKNISAIPLTFTRISCNEYCHIVIFADLVKDDSNYNQYEENWVFLNRDNYKDLTVLSMCTINPDMYHSLYMGYVNAVPKNQMLKVDMNKVSNNGYVRIINTTPSDNFHGSIKYPNRFLAKTLKNTTLQSQEFSTPNSFTGELLFPITSINYGNEISVSYSAKYSYEDVESNTYSIYNEPNHNFIVTVDCTKDAITPIKIMNY